MEPLKNVFSAELVRCFGFHLQSLVDGFDRNQFEDTVLGQLDSLELKQRSQLIADHIHAALPSDAVARRAVLYDMLHPEEGDNADRISDEQGIRSWGILPLTLVVAQHGVDDFDHSMQLLKEMTKRFTAEFAVRYFLLEDQNRAFKIMSRWVEDASHHVRRLVSEGSRPRLPWAMQLPALIDDPIPALSLLAQLRDDESEYVRRSVANHLNDIAKDHPQLVAAIANEWMKGADKNREKLVRHACRSLIKQGNPLALRAFGIEQPEISLTAFEGVFATSSPTVEFGSAVHFKADILSTSSEPQTLIIDYLMHFKKANGKNSAKVFKGTRVSLGAGESIQIKRQHGIKPITTRRYYPGTQGISLRINGQDFGYIEFDLVMAPN